MVHNGENHHADIHAYDADAIALTWPHGPLLIHSPSQYRQIQ